MVELSHSHDMHICNSPQYLIVVDALRSIEKSIFNWTYSECWSEPAIISNGTLQCLKPMEKGQKPRSEEGSISLRM